MHCIWCPEHVVHADSCHLAHIHQSSYSQILCGAGATAAAVPGHERPLRRAAAAADVRRPAALRWPRPCDQRRPRQWSCPPWSCRRCPLGELCICTGLCTIAFRRLWCCCWYSIMTHQQYRLGTCPGTKRTSANWAHCLTSHPPAVPQAAALQQQQQAYAAQLSQLAMLSQQSGAHPSFAKSP